MKPTTIPLICGISLASMIAAGASHWWSVQQLSMLLDSGATPTNGPLVVQPAADLGQAAAVPAQASLATAPEPEAPASITAFNAADERNQSKFYEALIKKLSRLENQNRELLDQMAETNRDLMELGFRVDTHAESFRPMPTVEEQPFSTLEPDSGILPPRSSPTGLHSFE